MKNNFKKQLRTYLQEISKTIPGNYFKKKPLLYALKQDIQQFLVDHPSATWEDVLEQFGSVSELSESYMAEISDTELIESLKKNKQHIYLTSGICFVLLIFLIMGIRYYANWWKNDAIITEETLYVFDGTEIPTEWQDDVLYGDD